MISGYLITLLLIGEHERTGTRRPARVLRASGPAAAAGAVHAADRASPIVHRAVQARRAGPAARRRARRARLRVELVPDLGRPGLHRVGRLRAAAPPVEPGRRGAVLPGVAARDDRPDPRSARRRLPEIGPLARSSPPSLVTVAVGLLYHLGSDRDVRHRRRAPTGTSAGAASRKTDTLYLSTPTRATGLLLGAAFAMVWRPVAIMRGPIRTQGPPARRRRACVGLAGPRRAVPGCCTSSPTDGADPWLFRGGFFVIGLASAARHRRRHPPRVRGPVRCSATRSSCGSAPAATGSTSTTGRSTRSCAGVAGRNLSVAQFDRRRWSLTRDRHRAVVPVHRDADPTRPRRPLVAAPAVGAATRRRAG